MMQCMRNVAFGLLGLMLFGPHTVAVADVPLNELTAAEKRGGWKLLFDGKSADSWRNYRKQTLSDGWAVKDGTLTRAKGRAGDIITKKKYGYFELSMEYNISKGGNSGIMFRVTEEDGHPPWWTGPEVQIQDNVDGHDPQKAGWLYQLYRPVKPAWAKRFEKQVGFKSPETDDATRPAGQWNHIYLRIARDQCEVALNGVSYYYFQIGNDEWKKRVAASKFAAFPQYGTAKEGHICLQDHGNKVSFRNIKIRELADDGSVPDPSDGRLNVAGRPAFPHMKWKGWQGVTEQGKVKPLRPITLTHAGDGTNRIFVASQIGMVHVFPNDPEVKQARLLLDLRFRVHDWAKDNEEGLLGFALHPNYKKTGELFVYYSSAAEPRTSIVSRFRVSQDNPNYADPDSEEIVMKIPQPFSNHNGGSIAFGHDGYLYIALGDGGGRNDPLKHAQNLKTWMGSVLRIDVDHKQDGLNYAIPVDNPFRTHKEAKPEIYAYGFRNIWRLSVDRKTGRLWVGDVGQDLWEEINVVQPGGNYGWSIREAGYGFGNDATEPPKTPIEPVWVYDHRVGKSITGGTVYRGSRLPELAGKYLYADFVSGKIWALGFDEKTGRGQKNWQIAAGGIPVLAFGEDESGEVYYMTESASGRGIYRFERTE